MLSNKLNSYEVACYEYLLIKIITLNDNYFTKLTEKALKEIVNVYA